MRGRTDTFARLADPPRQQLGFTGAMAESGHCVCEARYMSERSLALLIAVGFAGLIWVALQ